MDKLDENYLDLVRESLYKKQRVVSTKRSIVRSKNANKLTLEIAGNEEIPKNSVPKGFKTKKETFKAKAKLQNKSKKKDKPRQVAFIDNPSTISPPESSDCKKSSNKVQNRVATPYKKVEFAPKLKTKNKSPKLQESQDEIVSVTKNLSPSLTENDGTSAYSSNHQNLVVSKKDTHVKSKKRPLSESDRPEGNIKRKKEKPFEKKGKKLMFDDCFNEDSQQSKVFNGSPGIGPTNNIVTKKKVKNKCTDKNLNINFPLDTNWQDDMTESHQTHNTWEPFDYLHDKTNKQKKEKFVKKFKHKIGKTDDNKISKNNQENGGHILELDHSNKVSSLILKNNSDRHVTGNSTISEKTTCTNKQQTKESKNLKLKTHGSKKVDKHVLESNSYSSDNSTTSSDIEFKPKQIKKSRNTLEDTAEISDSCDNKTVGVKGLKFQRFCNMFAPTLNEQFLGQDIALRIPQKYFVVSKNDFESDWHCEERPSPKCKKNNSSRKLKNTNTSLEHTDTDKEVPTSEITELIDSDSVSKKKEQNKKINILDVQVLSKRIPEPISSTKDEETSDSQDPLNSSSLIQIRDETYYSLQEIPSDIINNRPVVVTLKNKNKIVALNFGAKMHFHGLFRIDVLMGNIEILGASLGPTFLNDNSSKENKLYSPRGTALLCIENKRSLFVDCSVKLKNLVNEDLLDERDAELTFESDYAIFMCSPLKEPHINFIEKYVSQKIFPEGDGQELRVDFNLQGSWNRIWSTEKWEEILEIIPENSKTVICGGKGVGKSTFIRYAVNFLLRRFKKIRVIDLDPGQSEFYYPGCISVVTVENEVFGPNYTHLLEPESSLLSHINVGFDIKKYHNSVQCLLESTKAMEELPTLINFPGFTQGIGLDISAQTLKLVEPTLVIQIQSKAQSKNYKVDLTADNVSKALNETNILSLSDESVSLSYRFVKFDSLAEHNKAWTLEARQGREMIILSYFGKLMTEHISDLTSVDDNLYSINISALSITNLEGRAISPAAINANLVALCSKCDENSDVFSCHGYGFVRGIDLQTDTLVLLTPESIKTLENVSHLVLSSVTTPPSLIMTASGLKGHIPYVSVGEPIDFGQFTKRSYLPPRK